MVRAWPLLVSVAIIGCGNTEPQAIRGIAELSTFPSTPSIVRARGRVSSEAMIGAGGAFELVLDGAGRYRIELISQNGAAGLIFPRKGGSIDAEFKVAGGGGPAFELGSVRYVGAPSMLKYSSEGIECEAGFDASGAVCVDDDETSASCGEEEDDDEADEGEEVEDDGLPSEAAVADHNLPASVGTCEDDD